MTPGRPQRQEGATTTELPAGHATDTRDGRINLLILASSLWIGGAETVIRHLAQTIDRQRFTVTVCCLKQKGSIGAELTRAGVDVVAFEDSAPAKVDYFTFRKLLRLVRERDVDVIHTHTAHGLVDASLCRLFRWRLRIVHTFHFGNYPHTNRTVLRMERTFWRFASRLFAVGEVQRGQIRAVYGLPDRSIGTIWNGVMLPPQPADRSFRDRLGTGDRVLIGTIATLIEQKGLRDVMRVAQRVRQAGLQAHFVIVGEGVLRPELEALRQELDVGDMVTMTGWITSAADVALPAFDVFFQPSLWEAMSVVILEAMAAAVPVVATRVGENPHIIVDGETGLLVDAKDVEGMTAALTHLIQDEPYRLRLGQAGRERIARRLTVDHMTRAYEGIYEDVVR
jgi:glycosyltransferase involved in cell wall biosynthesis